MNKTTDTFQRLLRKSGYKATTPRLAVLNILQKEKNPLSAQDIIDILKNEMDKATVYRILKALKEKGLIRQVDLRHNHAHYEITSDTEHHHLVCTECGRVEDVHDCGVEDTHTLILRHSKHFSEIKQHALEFYGICKSCSKKR
ncbi:MAG: Fur family transcriptional regulator [Patescibacteria group bacterium]